MTAKKYWGTVMTSYIFFAHLSDSYIACDRADYNTKGKKKW